MRNALILMRNLKRAAERYQSLLYEVGRAETDANKKAARD